MALEKRKEYIEIKEEKLRDKFGKEIKIINISGSINCPDCGYDPVYKKGTNPNCSTCKGEGKIFQEEEYIEKVIVFPITEIELKETEIGELKVGDFKLIARYEAKDYFIKAMVDKTPFLIDDIKVLPFRIIPTVLDTHIKVYCSRITE